MFSVDGNQGGRLSLDEDCNKVIREAFLYEQVSVNVHQVLQFIKQTKKSHLTSFAKKQEIFLCHMATVFSAQSMILYILVHHVLNKDAFRLGFVFIYP